MVGSACLSFPSLWKPWSGKFKEFKEAHINENESEEENYDLPWVVFFIDATDFIFHHGLTVRDIEKRFFAFNWKLKKLRPKFFDFFLLDRLTGNSRFYRFLQFLLNNKQKYMKTMFLQWNFMENFFVITNFEIWHRWGVKLHVYVSP